MSKPLLLQARLRAVGSRLCWIAIGGGLAAGLAVQLAAALIFPTPRALMACASIAALLGAAITAAVAQRYAGRSVALNAYVGWLATSAILMLQIAATTDVLSA
jgi:hypothetical protein